MDKKSRVFVIDGGNIMHICIFAAMNNPTVPPTYTYLNMITGYINRLNITLEDKIIIAQDYGKSWRKGIDKEYKAQRKEFRESKKPPEWWKEQYALFDKLFEKLEIAVNWYFIKIWAIEADDIAGVCCRYYKDREVILISGDKDWEMLESFENVKIWSPRSKKFKNIPYPTNILLEKIQGDKSDNLLTKPLTEAEFEKRKMIVDLTQLPDFVERPIKEALEKQLPKNLYIHKIPFMSIQDKFKKLYGTKKED